MAMTKRSLTKAIKQAHDLAVSAGQDGYIDPETGLFVMTSAYLHERGFCCDNGCRHCPYKLKADPEVKLGDE